MTRLLVCLIACSLATAAAGCTSMKTVPLATAPVLSPFEAVQAGDVVRVETRDGRRARFTVQQVDGDLLVADTGARYRRDDVVRLQRRSFSALRTAVLVGAALVGLVAGEAGGPF